MRGQRRGRLRREVADVFSARDARSDRWRGSDQTVSHQIYVSCSVGSLQEMTWLKGWKMDNWSLKRMCIITVQMLYQKELLSGSKTWGFKVYTPNNVWWKYLTCEVVDWGFINNFNDIGANVIHQRFNDHNLITLLALNNVYILVISVPCENSNKRILIGWMHSNGYLS